LKTMNSFNNVGILNGFPCSSRNNGFSRKPRPKPDLSERSQPPPSPYFETDYLTMEYIDSVERRRDKERDELKKDNQEAAR
jgi:hypothetical protein